MWDLLLVQIFWYDMQDYFPFITLLPISTYLVCTNNFKLNSSLYHHTVDVAKCKEDEKSGNRPIRRLPWLNLSISTRGTSSTSSPRARNNFIHALPKPSVPTTRSNKSRARPVSLYRPPTKTWNCCNPSLYPSLTITASFNLLSPTGLTCPVNTSNSNH